MKKRKRSKAKWAGLDNYKIKYLKNGSIKLIPKKGTGHLENLHKVTDYGPFRPIYKGERP